MNKLFFLLILYITILLFISCGGDNPANNSTGPHIGNWQPVSLYVKRYDVNGDVEIDSTMTYKEYMKYYGVTENDELIVEITDTKIISHQLIDSQYLTNENNYYLDGINVKGKALTDVEITSNVNYYTMEVENAQLVLSYDFELKDEYVIEYSRTIFKMTCDRYLGKVPPDEWPDNFCKLRTSYESYFWPFRLNYE